MKLNDTSVAGLTCPPGAKDVIVSDTAVPGFRVRVQASGAPTFLFAYKLGAVSRRLSLGTFGDVTTAAARKEAERLRGEVRGGRDPWGERKAAATSTLAAKREGRAKRAVDSFTVSALVDLYAAKHVQRLRPATQRDVHSRLRQHLMPIAKKPVVSIGRREAALVVDRAVMAGETTARRVRDYARAMWGWAQRRGTLPEGALNPWEKAPAPGSDVPRERVLDAGETGEVWRATGTLATPYGPLVRFALLTLCRREVATAMTWGEVSPDLSTWTQAAARTKNGKAHVVHLSEPARAILRAMLGAEESKPLPKLPKAERLVFAVVGGKAVTTHSWVKRNTDKAIAEARAAAAAEAGADAPEAMPHWTMHDFRRSGVTWLAGAGFAPHVADKLLNHTQGTIKGVAAIYQRGEFAEERKRALDAWGTHVLASAEGMPAADKVTDLAVHRRAVA
jgi:integrase